MPYVADPTDFTEPKDSNIANCLGPEMRAIKQYVQEVILATLNTYVSNNDARIQAIEDILNVDSGVTGLPATTGLLDVILANYQDINGDGALVPGILADIGTINIWRTATDTRLTTDEAAIAANAQLLNTVTTVTIPGINLSITNLTNALANLKPIPIGGVFLSTNSANPSTYIGYGTWERTAEGLYLSGVGYNSEIVNGVNFWNNFDTAGAIYGMHAHQINEGNLPAHNHISNVLTRTQSLNSVDNNPVPGYTSNYSPTSSPNGSATATWEHHKDYGTGQQKVPRTSNVGGNTPMPIRPKTMSFYCWKRVS